MKSDFNYISHGPVNKPVKKLVVVLHGYRMNATLMQKTARAISNDVPNAMVVIPHAPNKLKSPAAADKTDTSLPASKTPANSGTKNTDPEELREWLSLTGDKKTVRKNLSSVVEKINKFIDNQRDMLGLKDEDVALLGFSQGGSIALYTAYTRKNPMACVVAQSALFFSDKNLKTKLPTMLLYGTVDEQFTQQQYLDCSKNLKAYIPGSLTINKVKGLSHRISSESCGIAAKYIKKHL